MELGLVLNQAFRFKIGDSVWMKSAVADMGTDYRPTTFIIEQRLLQQCHGGIQFMYTVVGKADMIPEIGLVPSDREAYMAVRNEDRKRERAASEAAWKADKLRRNEG